VYTDLAFEGFDRTFPPAASARSPSSDPDDELTEEEEENMEAEVLFPSVGTGPPPHTDPHIPGEC
jgi:hypothetical protein